MSQSCKFDTAVTDSIVGLNDMVRCCGCWMQVKIEAREKVYIPKEKLPEPGDLVRVFGDVHDVVDVDSKALGSFPIKLKDGGWTEARYFDQSVEGFHKVYLIQPEKDVDISKMVVFAWEDRFNGQI